MMILFSNSQWDIEGGGGVKTKELLKIHLHVHIQNFLIFPMLFFRNTSTCTVLKSVISVSNF